MSKENSIPSSPSIPKSVQSDQSVPSVQSEKFTPGPWNLQDFSYWQDKSRLVITKTEHGSTKTICRMKRPYGDIEEIFANAHLLLAAPEMYDWQYATLDVLRQICRSLNTPDNIRIQLEPLIYNGEKIQKKARS